MALLVTNLNLPAANLAEIATALGDTGSANAALQGYCDSAAADVSRLIAGYVIDDLSQVNWGRAIALYRVYGQIGPVPKDIEKNYDEAWKELQSIAKGERINLPKVPVPALASRAGAIGGPAKVCGRLGDSSFN